MEEGGLGMGIDEPLSNALAGGETGSAVALETMRNRLRTRFQGTFTDLTLSLAELSMEIPGDRLLDVCYALRDEPEFAFKQLVDLCGVDYLGYGRSDWETSELATTAGFSRGVEPAQYADQELTQPRFAVVYHLLSYQHNQRLRLRVYASGDPPRVNSVVDVWNSADWYEREAFDLFGILFEGHPDLRRILTDYGFIGYPFRKDFPLIGNVEMRYDPDKQRVVYEPVSIEPRTLVPRVIRHDHRYSGHHKTQDQNDA